MNPNRNLEAGYIVRCAIVKCSKSSGTCSVQLSTLVKEIQSSYVNPSYSMNCFVPGFQFEVSVVSVRSK